MGVSVCVRRGSVSVVDGLWLPKNVGEGGHGRLTLLVRLSLLIMATSQLHLLPTFSQKCSYKFVWSAK